MNRTVGNLFSDLEELDPSLKTRPQMHGKLARRQTMPQPYSQRALFSAMASGEVALFDNFPSPITNSSTSSPVRQMETVLKRMGRHKRFNVRCGPSGSSKYLNGHELVQRWNSSRAMVNVTDLHIRNTAIERLADPTNLSWFNVLPDCAEDAAAQEMMSLVVSSRGCVSDSHSDAPDSSNYCFTGEKVWLYWDTFEGQKLGLEDCSVDTVFTECSFDMSRFLKLRSARWLRISEGQALFLPGEYTHKVVTTKQYLGVGSFYVSLPNSLRSLSRWTLHGPLWSQGQATNTEDQALVDITQQVKKTIKKLRKRSTKCKQRLGYDYLPHALENWHRSTGKRQQQKILASAPFSDYMQLLHEVGRNC